ncbi:MAG: B12-binding domain-containing radical SAM protein [Candidatus Margulisbacteria bacterium]|nr:B12-binding domain-containing radical SAM protein [Candidatus Margulisiibacteriota bacterium]
MDVVLVNPNPGGKGLNEATVEPPLGLAYITAMLEKNNFKCKIIDANVLGLSNDDTIARIPKNTKLIGFYMNSYSYNAVQDLVKKVKILFKDSLTIIGGPVPSASDPATLLKEIKCDALIRGEGEYSVLEITKNIKVKNSPFDGPISGLAYLKSDQSLIVNPIQRILNLDQLPFPSFHLLPPFKTYKTRSRKKPVAAIITSRGCAFNCSFCSKDIFERKVTYRSAQNVLEEVDFLVNNYKIKQIDILDDNFAQNKKRFVEILDGLIERKYNLALNFQSGIRVENIDKNILEKMKKAGVYKLAFGIETFDENVLKIHHKKLNIQKIEEIVKMAKQFGFLVYGFFIIGLPGETEEGFKKTLYLTKKLDFDVANFTMAVPFVNTELYRMIQENGRFLIDTSKNIDVGFYGGKVFFEYGDCTQNNVLKRYKKAYKEFYSFRKRLKILMTIKSISELIWLITAMFSIVKNSLKIFTYSKK